MIGPRKHLIQNITYYSLHTEKVYSYPIIGQRGTVVPYSILYIALQQSSSSFTAEKNSIFYFILLNDAAQNKYNKKQKQHNFNETSTGTEILVSQIHLVK